MSTSAKIIPGTMHSIAMSPVAVLQDTINTLIGIKLTSESS